MELEDLKTGWSVLNERLMKNEILNTRIVKEMITKRTLTAYDRLLRTELFNIAVITFLCLILPAMYRNIPELTYTSFILLEIVMVCSLFLQLFIASFLFRFNVGTMKSIELARLILNYKVWTKRNRFFGSLFGILFIIVFILIQQIYLVPGKLFNIIVALCIGLAIGALSYKYHKRRIESIEKGLEELKEFEN